MQALSLRGESASMQLLSQVTNLASGGSAFAPRNNSGRQQILQLSDLPARLLTSLLCRQASICRVDAGVFYAAYHCGTCEKKKKNSL
mmetsp:Transcript_8978/g.10955  ORF Transcript_8978/g.10955 Transcript_8978/m.10955 type:complete len:87 (-) Transcript_8978:2-262(-)